MLFWAHLWATGCSCRLHHGLLLRRKLRQEQVAQADQVVGDHMQAKHGTDFVLAAQFELAQSAECLLLRRSLRLEPTEHLLDPPVGIDRLGIAHVTGGAAIDLVS